MNEERNVAQYNTTSVLCLAEHLGLPQDKVLRSSQLSYAGTSNEMLISLVQAVGGTVYMCGGGADGYQDEALFTKAGVSLIRQEFKYPVYSQGESGSFVPGLSIIDAVAWIGFAGVRRLLGREV